MNAQTGSLLLLLFLFVGTISLGFLGSSKELGNAAAQNLADIQTRSTGKPSTGSAEAVGSSKSRQAQFYANRALARRKKNDLEGAFEDLSHALDFSPHNAQLYLERAYTGALLGWEQEVYEDCAVAAGLRTRKRETLKATMPEYCRDLGLD